MKKKEETYSLICAASGGDKKAMEILVEENMGLVTSIAKKLCRKNEDLNDFIQIGCIGLINAIKKFDTKYGVMFSTYAVPMIAGEIKRYLRDDGALKVSRSYKTLAQNAYKVRERYIKKYGCEPTIDKISAELKSDKCEIAAALDAVRPPESLYASGDDNLLLIDKINGGVSSETKIVERIALRDAIESLADREKRIVILRYFRDKTQADTAKLLGISQVQVSRIEKKILMKIHSSFA